jgi:hypothetical protein
VTTPVKAFACGRCAKLWLKRSAADKCCVCPVCKHSYEKDFLDKECGHCAYPKEISRLRAYVKVRERDAREARGHLDAALAKKRPPKGSPGRWMISEKK